MGAIGHNGGPPLDDDPLAGEEPHIPEWEDGDIGIHFAWKRAHAAAWKAVPWETMLRRQERAERIGLTYEEYALEILERGRHLGPDDAERVAAIKAARRRPALVGGSNLRHPRARPEDPPRGISPAASTRPGHGSSGRARG